MRIGKQIVILGPHSWRHLPYVVHIKFGKLAFAFGIYRRWLWNIKEKNFGFVSYWTLMRRK